MPPGPAPMTAIRRWSVVVPCASLWGDIVAILPGRAGRCLTRRGRARAGGGEGSYPRSGRAARGRWPMATEHRTFCRICSAACALVVTTDGERVLGARGDVDDPVSRGYSCPKGRSVGALQHHPKRIDGAQMRDASGAWAAARWDDCLDDLAARLRDVRAEHGDDAVAVYMATASTFDSIGSRYAARFAQGLATRNRYSAVTLDSPSKPLVAELMAGRSDLLPAVDRERATLSIFIGVNPVVSHGHFNAFPDPVTRIRELSAGDREVWVIDPRLTETARLATRFLQPRPGTDWILLAHVVRELLAAGADATLLEEHASG